MSVGAGYDTRLPLLLYNCRQGSWFEKNLQLRNGFQISCLDVRWIMTHAFLRWVAAHAQSKRFPFAVKGWFSFKTNRIKVITVNTHKAKHSRHGWVVLHCCFWRSSANGRWQRKKCENSTYILKFCDIIYKILKNNEQHYVQKRWNILLPKTPNFFSLNFEFTALCVP